MKHKPLDDYEFQYANLVEEILTEGVQRQTRNAVTKSLFGRSLRINMEENEFPILLGRQMFYKGVLGELAALLKGPKTLADFKAQGCNYWDKWAKPDGSIEVDYGNAWIDFNGVNQLRELVAGLKQDPYGRRHIVTGWRPDRLKELSLPCCHLLYQWYVNERQGHKFLDMMWYQRSVDTMIGLPSDVLLAYVWNCLVANDVGMQPGEIVLFLGDTHIYEQHYDNAMEYLKRVRTVDLGERPKHLPFTQGQFDFDPKAFELFDYKPMSKIDFELIA